MNRQNYRKEDIVKTLQMAWPAMLESFFVALAGMVDSLMVSSLGSYAVAAVGLTTQPKFLGLALFIACNVSISALVARRKGEDNREGANRIFVTFLSFVLVIAVLMSALLAIYADPIIHLCGSESTTHESAVEYYRIIMGGMIFNVISLGINAAQRGSGNTRITMRTNVTSNALNVLFNYLLIGGHFGFPALGIRGAAIATVLGTVVACIMSIASICTKRTFVSIPYIILQKLKPGWESFCSIIKVAYSVFLEQILVRFGFMMTALMAADQGTAAMAAHQVGMNILSLSFAFGDGLQATAVALIGYSLGRKEPEQAKRYGRTCQMIGLLISLVLAVIYFLGGKWLYELFFAEAEIVAIGVQLMRVVIFIVILQISQVIFMGSLRGAGDTLFTAVVGMISVSIIRTLVSWLGGYVLGLGIVGIWFGILADQLARFIMGSIRFKQGKWIKIKI